MKLLGKLLMILGVFCIFIEHPQLYMQLYVYATGLVTMIIGYKLYSTKHFDQNTINN